MSEISHILTSIPNSAIDSFSDEFYQDALPQTGCHFSREYGIQLCAKILYDLE